MLDGAAAADAEMRTQRRDPVRACLLDPEQAPAVGMSGHGLRLDGLAAERIGHIDVRAIRYRDAVAAMADMIDGETFGFSHGAHR